MGFTAEVTRIPGVLLLTPAVIADERGLFFEVYKQSAFRDLGIDVTFVQENHSQSTRGTLRGLHFQRDPMAQGKLVRVVAGEIFDVVVDVRESSPTYGQWVGIQLVAAEHRSLYVPPGCAHGFCVVSAEAEVVYLTTREYAPEYEDGILWSDPALGITWPVEEPILSRRDQDWPPLARASRASTTSGRP